jgi:type II secretory pathway predicted ATPase ExeA
MEHIEAVIPRENLVKQIRILITPTKRNRLYPLIIGEYGTGKTSLIQLAVNSIEKDKPIGITYVDLPPECSSETKIARAMLLALGWSPDPVLDSGQGNYSSSLPFFF